MYSSIKEVIENRWEDSRKNFTVFHNGSWVKASTVKIKKENKKLLKITTANNKEIIITEDHVQPTLSGNKTCNTLTTKDYLAFNTTIRCCSRKG